jgi:hypothetical protein
MSLTSGISNRSIYAYLVSNPKGVPSISKTIQSLNIGNVVSSTIKVNINVTIESAICVSGPPKYIINAAITTPIL